MKRYLIKCGNGNVFIVEAMDSDDAHDQAHQILDDADPTGYSNMQFTITEVTK